jgi:hypothetical protein
MYQMGTAEAGKQLQHFLKALLAWGHAMSTLDKATCDRVVFFATLATRLVGQIIWIGTLAPLWSGYHSHEAELAFFALGLWIPVRRVVMRHCMPISRQEDAEHPQGAVNTSSLSAA